MNEDCTLYKTAEFLGKKWTILILLELNKGKNKKKRYSELKKSIPKITPKILSSRLKELEREKLIQKTVDNLKFPIKSKYSLTKIGKEFINVIEDMKKWALKYKFKNVRCSQTSCEDCEF